jgi:sulfotransferase family protein
MDQPEAHSPPPRDVLIAGVARSGTTWIGRVLGETTGVRYVHEPDNHVVRPFALRVKRPLGPFPILDGNESAPDFERLWASVFDRAAQDPEAGWSLVERAKRSVASRVMRRLSTDRLRASFRDPSHRPPLASKLVELTALPPVHSGDGTLITKSVHLAFCLEWVAAHWDIRVVVVSRHPLAVIASWMKLGYKGHYPEVEVDPRVQERYLDRWGVRPLPKGSSELVSIAWAVGMLSAAHDDAASRHPEWVEVSHDRLVTAPKAGFRELAASCGLTWSDRAERFLHETDRPGDSYEINRVTSEVLDGWRQKFSEDDVKEVAAVLERFPIRGWPNETGSDLVSEP